MTYTIRTRGAGSYLVAEYRCPTHGVFEATVQRDANGDAPDAMRCPQQEYIDARTMQFIGGACGVSSPWTISAPAVESEALKVRAVSRGGDMKERPPGMLDTRGLAEGQSITAWKKERREEQKRRRHKQLVDKGVISKKIQVG